MIEKYTNITLKDGRTRIVVDMLGSDYIVDVGTSPEGWDTVIISPDDIIM